MNDLYNKIASRFPQTRTPGMPKFSLPGYVANALDSARQQKQGIGANRIPMYPPPRQATQMPPGMGGYAPPQAPAQRPQKSPYIDMAEQFGAAVQSGRVPPGVLPDGWSDKPSPDRIYPAVMPKRGYMFIYDPTGGRHQVPVNWNMANAGAMR